MTYSFAPHRYRATCVTAYPPGLTKSGRQIIKNLMDRDIEPKTICANCEYFDGGGLRPDGTTVNANGDCLNHSSPRLTTTVEGTCAKFFPCSARWPDADHG